MSAADIARQHVVHFYLNQALSPSLLSTREGDKHVLQVRALFFPRSLQCPPRCATGVPCYVRASDAPGVHDLPMPWTALQEAIARLQEELSQTYEQELARERYKCRERGLLALAALDLLCVIGLAVPALVDGGGDDDNDDDDDWDWSALWVIYLVVLVLFAIVQLPLTVVLSHRITVIERRARLRAVERTVDEAMEVVSDVLRASAHSEVRVELGASFGALPPEWAESTRACGPCGPEGQTVPQGLYMSLFWFRTAAADQEIATAVAISQANDTEIVIDPDAIADRLADLDRLHKDGLLSHDEVDAARARLAAWRGGGGREEGQQEQ